MAASERALELARAAAVAAEDKIASTITAIDVSDQLALTDVFLIVSASNERQVGAIVDGIEDTLRAMGSKPIRREGQREGRWVLIDFGDIVAHVQHEEEKDFYELERLWKDCPALDLGVRGRDQQGGERSGAQKPGAPMSGEQTSDEQTSGEQMSDEQSGGAQTPPAEQ